MPHVRAWHLRVALLLLTAAAYLPLYRNDFVDFDDETYITANPNVTEGVSGARFAWAWSNLDAKYWQPVSWLSLQLDAHLFSTSTQTGKPVPSPVAFHAENLFWHAANVLLLFGLFDRVSGARGCSFLVAALFALHPMHVESVAWAAERKDVLSVFFGLLTLWAYVRYVAAPRWDHYLALAAAFALSLLRKPMLMTLPFALLLFDYWPLGRLLPAAPEAAQPSRRRLILEKVPLFALAAAVAVITWVARARTEASVPLSTTPLPARLANAGTAYGWYLYHTAYPAGLSAFYLHPRGNWSVLPVVAGTGALLAVTLLSVWQARRRPWLIAGWLWFVGSLVPVIGLAQGGEQAWADRFTYWPHVGLFAAVVWGLAEVVRRGRVPAAVAASAAALALGALGLTTWTQVGYWRDTVTLWERVLSVTEDNSIAHLHLGTHYLNAGRPDRAEHHLAEAVRICPDAADMRYPLGVCLLTLGKEDEAAEQFLQAVARQPTCADAWHNLGVARLRQGRPDRAARAFRKELELQPASADGLANLGQALVRGGKRRDASRALRAALALDPGCAGAWYGLGLVSLTEGDSAGATQAFREALRLNPSYVNAHSQMGVALGRQGRWSEAVTYLQTAVRLQAEGERVLAGMGGRAPAPESVPQLVIHQCRLAFALSHLRDDRGAAEAYRAASRRAPGWPETFTARAWELVEGSDEDLRDPALAYEMAAQALQGGPSASAVDALAAAEAAGGRVTQGHSQLYKEGGCLPTPGPRD